MLLGHLLLLFLVSLFLIGFAFVTPAQGQSQPDLENQPALGGPTSSGHAWFGQALPERFAGDLANKEFRLPLQPDFPLNRKVIGAQTEKEPVCYAMRTYRVRRVDRSSDTVEFSGYSTCQPSSSYSVKDAVGRTAVPSP